VEPRSKGRRCAREMGIGNLRLYTWKRKYGGWACESCGA
jgi:hypothetical protein